MAMFGYTLVRQFSGLAPRKRLNMSEVKPLSHFLHDSFGRGHNYLRISITEKCNLRCAYCMPEEGVPLTPKTELLTNAEIVSLASIFVSHGVNKIRLTGGEPTIRKDLNYLIKSLSHLNGVESIGLTSNGIALSRSIGQLVASGLTHLNLSLDTLKSEKYAFVTRRMGFDKVWECLQLAEHALGRVKVNCVVMRGLNEDEILDFVELTKFRNLDIRFIEYMPFGGNKWNTKKMVTYEEMIGIIRDKYRDIQRLEDKPNDTSKVCLHGNAEISLRDCLRGGASETQLTQVIGEAIGRKKKQHAGMLNLSEMPNRPMILIGNTTGFLGNCSVPYQRNNLSVIHSDCVLNVANLKNVYYKSERCIHTSTHLNTQNPKLQQFLQKWSRLKNGNLSAVIQATEKNQFVGLLLKLLKKIYQKEALKKRAAVFVVGKMKSSAEQYKASKPKPPTPLAMGPTSLTHFDHSGTAHMVDIGCKVSTEREAKATCLVRVSRDVVDALQNNQLKKGDALSIAEMAGIMGCKKTSDLIPLCHQIPLTHAQVSLVLDPESCTISVNSVVRCEHKTGVEMEALVGCSIAALTLYDMTKSVSKGTVIDSLKLTAKYGGKSGVYDNMQTKSQSETS